MGIVIVVSFQEKIYFIGSTPEKRIKRRERDDFWAEKKCPHHIQILSPQHFFSNNLNRQDIFYVQLNSVSQRLVRENSVIGLREKEIECKM